MRRLALCLPLLVTTACSTAALVQASALPTRCPEHQLEISEANQPLEGPSSWTAICRAPDAEPQAWFCSRAQTQTEAICTDLPR